VKLFIRHDRDGNILSVIKVQAMHESVEHPHGSLEPGEQVTQVKPNPEQAKLDAHELVLQYSVDVKNSKLQKKRAPRGTA
jgi:hypothetical protein